MTYYEEFLKDKKKYIKECLLDNNGNPNKRKKGKFLSKEIEEYLLTLSSDINSSLYIIINDLDTFKKCPVCSKECELKSFTVGFRGWCSITCKNKDKTTRDSISKKNSENSSERMKKREETTLKKYGVKHISQVKEIHDRAVESNMKRFEDGTHGSLKKESNEKRISTNIERYGIDNPMKNHEIKEKARINNINSLKTGFDKRTFEETKYKIKQTLLEKYNTTCYFNVIHKEHQDNMRRLYSEGKHTIQSEAYKNKKKQKLFEKYNLDYEKFNNSDYLLEITKQYHSLYELKNGPFNGLPVSTIRNHYIKCNVIPQFFNENSSSIGERELKDFVVKTIDQNIIFNSRKIIAPYELDIYIPSKNMAIEFNGNYWHSSIYKTDNYHLDKTLKCQNENINLIHIFEDEWNNKKDIIKSIIKSKLSLHDKIIGARNCHIKELSYYESKKFMEENHLQGHINGKYFGLIFDNEIMCAIGIGIPRFNKNYKWELLRFCNKLNISVSGGFSKLLKYIKHELNIVSPILTYSDRRFSDGSLYRKFALRELLPSKPNYYWIDNKFNIRIPRYKTQKHKLKNFLGINNFNEVLSETENMENNGFLKIWDCGNYIFEL